MLGLPVPCVLLFTVRPSSRRCLFTVRAAISSARAGSIPRSSSLSLMLSYIFSSFLLQLLGIAASWGQASVTQAFNFAPFVRQHHATQAPDRGLGRCGGARRRPRLGKPAGFAAAPRRRR